MEPVVGAVVSVGEKNALQALLMFMLAGNWRFSHPAGVLFVATQHVAGGTSDGCRVVSNDALRAASVRYEDLVRASDAILSKPGYGIVAECIANGTSLVYTSRGRFAEYPRLVEGIEQRRTFDLAAERFV